MGEDIYSSKKTQDLKPAAAVLRSWRSHSSTAAVFLDMLCLILLSGVIGLAVGHQTIDTIQMDQPMTREKSFCHELCDKLREVKDKLKPERDQFRETYQLLRMERDELRMEREQLRMERDELRMERELLRMEREQLRMEREQLRMERDQLKKETPAEDGERPAEDRDRHDLKWQRCERNSGWKVFGSSCYIVSNDTKTWQDSRADCKSKGGDLAIINSIAEEEFVFNLATTHLWFGMTDIEVEGIWIWVDGTPVTTTYWEPVEPNNGAGKVGEEDCAFISRAWVPNNRNPLHGWFDYGCGRQINYICEIAMQE